MKFAQVNIKWWEYMLLVFIDSYFVSTVNDGTMYISEHKQMFGTTYVISVEAVN